MYFVQLRIAPQNPKTPILKYVNFFNIDNNKINVSNLIS